LGGKRGSVGGDSAKTEGFTLGGFLDRQFEPKAEVGEKNISRDIRSRFFQSTQKTDRAAAEYEEASVNSLLGGPISSLRLVGGREPSH